MTSNDRDFQFGALAISLGLIDQEQVRGGLGALSALHRAGVRQSLGQLLVEQGVLTARQVRQVLARQGKELMVCARADCGGRFNVLGYDSGKRYHCKRCGGELLPASMSEETIRVDGEAGESATMPALEQRAAEAPDAPTLLDVIADTGVSVNVAISRHGPVQEAA